MNRIAIIILLASVLVSCEKELDFQYRDVGPVVVIEGRVTNEGTWVRLTKSRSVNDSVKSPCQQGAQVVVSFGDQQQALSYDAATDSYTSPLVGAPGTTYTLSVDYEGCRYQASSTMPPPAPIVSAEFLWQSVLSERLLVYEVWAKDPEPEVRNYYWYRVDRRSQHPHLQDVDQSQPYRWTVFDDRGNPPGLIYRDVMCTTERVMDEDEEDNWESILYDGDLVTFTLMAIDRPTYEYLASLRAGQNGGANPTTNFSGGCQGYFTATSITRSPQQEFKRSQVKYN